MNSHHYNHTIKRCKMTANKNGQNKQKRFYLTCSTEHARNLGQHMRELRAAFAFVVVWINKVSKKQKKEPNHHTGSCRISQGNRRRTLSQPDESAEFVCRGKARNFIIKAQWVKRRSAKPQRRPTVMFNVEYVRMMAFAFSSRHCRALKGPVRHIYRALLA